MVGNKGNYVFQSDFAETNVVSPDIEISVVTTLKDFKDFFRVSSIVYQDDDYWVAPFWVEFKTFFRRNNPFWTHGECKLFIAKKNNKIVGRIAAIIDYKFCETIGRKIGYFGFFECIEDYQCAEALFKSTQNWLGLKQMTVMRGPINGRVDIGCGFLHTGFESRQSFFYSYSPPYYLSFAEQFNMKKSRDQLLYYIDLTKPLPKVLQEKAQKGIASGVKISKFNRLRTQKELKWWIDFFLETFAEHWGYVPLSPDEVRTRFGLKQLRWFVDTPLFLIAEYNGSPVAFIWSMPDYNRIFQKMKGRFGPYQILQFLLLKRRINVGVMPLIGVKKKFRSQNIGSYLNYLTLVEMKKRGYIGAEVVWIDKGNDIANTTIAKTGAKLYKKSRVFDKPIHTT